MTLELASSCTHSSNEPWGSIQSGEFFD